MTGCLTGYSHTRKLFSAYSTVDNLIISHCFKTAGKDKILNNGICINVLGYFTCKRTAYGKSVNVKRFTCGGSLNIRHSICCSIKFIRRTRQLLYNGSVKENVITRCAELNLFNSRSAVKLKRECYLSPDVRRHIKCVCSIIAYRNRDIFAVIEIDSSGNIRAVIILMCVVKSILYFRKNSGRIRVRNTELCAYIRISCLKRDRIEHLVYEISALSLTVCGRLHIFGNFSLHRACRCNVFEIHIIRLVSVRLIRREYYITGRVFRTFNRLNNADDNIVKVEACYGKTSFTIEEKYAVACSGRCKHVFSLLPRNAATVDKIRDKLDICTVCAYTVNEHSHLRCVKVVISVLKRKLVCSTNLVGVYKLDCILQTVCRSDTEMQVIIHSDDSFLSACPLTNTVNKLDICGRK